MLYLLGLGVAMLYIFWGLDDLIWDVAFIFRKNHRDNDKISVEELDSSLPKLLAVVIVSWKEDNVLGDVISNLIETAQYPASMYHIFLGVYPNDDKTLAVARKLSSSYENVHVMINSQAGPTTKADNINSVLRQIKDFERDRGWEFKAFVIHDSEDVVHPYEFKLENYLLDKYDALQFPVFPLQQKPNRHNIFRNMTVGTYADEFAENHFHTMAARNRAQAFVPSAGTGFALSRKIILDFDFQNVFPEDSLTEDYKLSLTLERKGYHLHYVLEGIERLDDDGRLVREYVSTRSRFPATFQAAVRQKTRWIFGITMQSIKFRNIFADDGLNMIQRYSLYKDWKAKFANLANLFGYLVFAYLLLSLLVDLPVIYPRWSLSWYLCVFLTAMMIERQLLRAVAIKNVYGWRSVAVACLFPPLMPLRLVWGNIINLVATLKAWKQLFFAPTKPKQANQPSQRQKWDKTEHEFLEKSVLRRYHLRLGDALLAKKLISAEQLKNALRVAKDQGKLLGQVLLEKELVAEENLLVALSEVKHMIFVPLASFGLQDHMENFGWQILEKIQAVPLLRQGDAWAVAVSAASPSESKAWLEQACGGQVYLVYSTIADIRLALQRLKSTIILPESQQLANINRLLEQDRINFEQVFLAMSFADRIHQPVGEILKLMGLGNCPEGDRATRKEKIPAMILCSPH